MGNNSYTNNTSIKNEDENNFSDDEIYINEGTIAGEKPEISEKQRNELINKGKDATCKISLPDVIIGNGFFCNISYNNQKYNILLINREILSKNTLNQLKHLKIRYQMKNILILIKDMILKLHNNNYSVIKIKNNAIKNFYEIKDNFNGEFNKEIEENLKKKGDKYKCEILLDILGSGFFCKIPYKNNIINILFTNHHVINENLLIIGKKIRIYYKGEYKEIEITKNRLFFTDSRDYNEGLDYTAIQILKEDGFNDNNFFEKDNSNLSNYSGISICVLQYPNGNQLELQTGYIKDLNNYEIFHSANTLSGSSGSPIICLNKNYNVIGIHRRYDKKNQLNMGSYMNDILKHISSQNKNQDNSFNYNNQYYNLENNNNQYSKNNKNNQYRRLSGRKKDFLKSLKNKIIKIIMIDPNIFDERFDKDNNWGQCQKRGPPGFLMDYDPPLGWIGFGLKVLNLYDNGDNSWLSNGNIEGEWYIAYHVTYLSNVRPILEKGFRAGPGQVRNYDINVNPLSNREFPTCGVGVYLTPYIKEAENYLQHKLSCLLMCRVNPYKVRICKSNTNYWIVSGDFLNNLNVKKYDNEIRIYRILIKKNDF